jgi:hypothetical protein
VGGSAQAADKLALAKQLASKLQQKFMSKDQNQMVSRLKGRVSWDLECLFSQQTPAEVHEQGPEPDGKWDYKGRLSWDLGCL